MKKVPLQHTLTVNSLKFFPEFKLENKTNMLTMFLRYIHILQNANQVTTKNSYSIIDAVRKPTHTSLECNQNKYDPE